jgi:ankyrin repeat protein
MLARAMKVARSLFLCWLAGLALTRLSHAGSQSDTLSECFVLKHVGNALFGRSAELCTRAPDGRLRTIGSMPDVGFQMSALGFAGALEHLDRQGTETQFAVSRDGQAVVFRSQWPIGKGADRVDPGIHRYVCGTGDTLLYPGGRCDLSYGAPKNLPRDVMLFGLTDSVLDPHHATLALRADGHEVPLVLLDAPALHAAAYDGRVAPIDSLMRLGADPLAKNLLEMTAVDVALWAGNEDAAMRLIEGAPRDTTTFQEFLSVAILYARGRTLGSLLARGADPNHPIARRAGPVVSITPLMIALESPPQLGRCYWADRGNTPVRSNEETLRLLLDHGADPNGVDPQGRTILHMIAQSSEPVATTLVAANLVAARALIERGADVMRPSARGNTPLHTLVGTHDDMTYSQSDFRARWGHDPYGQMLELFVAHAKNLEVRNEKGMTPLQRAIETRNFLAAQYLVAHGASDQVEYQGHSVREILADELKHRRGSGYDKFREELFARRYEGAAGSATLRELAAHRRGPE